MSFLIENLSTLQNVIYIISSMLFITGIKMLGKEDTAVRGNFLSALAMFIAVSITLVNVVNPLIIIIGISVGAIIGSVIALKVKMTSIPEMVALFNGFGGLATFFIAWSEYSTTPENYFQYILIMLTTFIGGVTFTGSIVAYGKLSERLTIKKTSLITKLFTTIFYISLFYLIYSTFFTDIFEPNFDFYLILIILTLLGGIGFVLPIGGGDMPVVISLLNSFSGIAAAFAGLILTIIMAKAMNRSIGNILFVGYASSSSGSKGEETGEVKPINVSDAFLILENASSVLVVPGYGMAVAQAQHVVRELGELLEANGTEVKYGIHPVAGRMPGHMNVLLAEANVPYDVLVEPDDVNPTMDSVDVAVVIGANDVVNPSATEEPGSPIYGMPIIEVHNSRTVFVLKRSMSSGFAGVQNPLFFKENTRMLFGDAKESIGGLVSEFKE
jgi:NAD(P) transhydrogenase subunit beta